MPNLNDTPRHKRLWPAEQGSLSEAQLDTLFVTHRSLFTEFIKTHRLTDNLLSQCREIYLPLAARIVAQQTNSPLVVGINGAQGAGKSTLTQALELILSQVFKKSVVAFSIDDLYLSRQQREKLATDIHPLLRVRGVPGTHDVKLAIKILSALGNDGNAINVSIPRFDKATDDLAPVNTWQFVTSPVEIILFEGWCVGASAEPDEALLQDVNDLETTMDPDRRWREYVNQQLNNDYHVLFAMIDFLIMLDVPDMDCVLKWRTLQEQKLAENYQDNKTANHIMSAEQVADFIRYYERLTRSMLAEMPARADVVLKIDSHHQIVKVICPH